MAQLKAWTGSAGSSLPTSRQPGSLAEEHLPSRLAPHLCTVVQVSQEGGRVAEHSAGAAAGAAIAEPPCLLPCQCLLPPRRQRALQQAPPRRILGCCRCRCTEAPPLQWEGHAASSVCRQDERQSGNVAAVTAAAAGAVAFRPVPARAQRPPSCLRDICETPRASSKDCTALSEPLWAGRSFCGLCSADHAAQSC